MNVKTTNASTSLKKNAIFNIIYQLVQIAIPIILIPILSGRLETGGNGSYAFIHSIVLYFSYFALLGVNYFGTKAIAAKKAEGKGEEKKTFWIIFFAKAMTSIVAIGGYLAFCFIYNQSQFVLFTQILFLVGNFLDVSWFFMGDENFKAICIRNIAIKSLSLIFIIIFVKQQSDIGIYSLILGLAEVLNHIFMWALLLRRKIFSKENFSNVSFKEIGKALKGMVIFFVPQLLIELYTILNTTILGVVWGSTLTDAGEVAIFDYANKIVSVLTTIAVSLGMVFLARIASLEEQKKTKEIQEKIQSSMFFSLFISLPMVVGIIGVGHSIVHWFLDGEGWNKVGTLLYFLPLKVIFVAISNTIGVQYLVSTGKLKKYIISVAVGAIVCICLNLVLVKTLGAIGSAISVVVAEFCVTVTQILLVRKEIDFLAVIKRLWKPAIGCLVMGAYLVVIYLFGYNNTCMFFSSILKSSKGILALSDITIAIIGALIYFGTIILLKEETMMRVFEKLHIKQNKRVFVGVVTLLTSLTIALSTSLYTSYSIRFDKAFSARKRSLCVALEKDARKVTFSDNYASEHINKPFVTILPDEYEAITSSFDKKSNRGIIYHYREGYNSIDMITTNFYFYQCLDYGSSFDICLKYAIKESPALLKNLDKLMVCFDIHNNADDSETKFFITDEDGTFTNYFKNKKRDFVAINGNTSIWNKEDFKAEKNGELIHRDNCYCTVSLFFVDNEIYQVAPSLRALDLKQEIWVLNGK